MAELGPDMCALSRVPAQQIGCVQQATIPEVNHGEQGLPQEVLDAIAPSHSTNDAHEGAEHVVDNATTILVVGAGQRVPEWDPVEVAWGEVDHAISMHGLNQPHKSFDHAAAGVEDRDTVTFLDVMQSHALHERRLACPRLADHMRVP
jgi:hypothetical protein